MIASPHALRLPYIVDSLTRCPTLGRSRPPHAWARCSEAERLGPTSADASSTSLRRPNALGREEGAGEPRQMFEGGCLVSHA